MSALFVCVCATLATTTCLLRWSYSLYSHSTMRYIQIPPSQPTSKQLTSNLTTPQPYDAFLILDVEATCFQGTDFNYPNEIIEFPICLMKWQDRDEHSRATKLHVVDEFRSFVRPTWRPTLSAFCTELTGITQDQVDSAPLFPDVLKQVRAFLVKNGLIDDATGKRLVRFCWGSDGPFDIRDFVVKQCFISNITMPDWLQGDVLDVRMSVVQWLNSQPSNDTTTTTTRTLFPPIRRSLNIPAQLNALGLPTFQGRQHSGIDDTRNISKIVMELARRGIQLRPNTVIKNNRRWMWMGKAGQVLEEFCVSFSDSVPLSSSPVPEFIRTPRMTSVTITDPSSLTEQRFGIRTPVILSRPPPPGTGKTTHTRFGRPAHHQSTHGHSTHHSHRPPPIGAPKPTACVS